MKRFDVVLLILLASGLACDPAGSRSPSSGVREISASPAAPRVILISLDGTRPADLSEETLPSLVAFARRGVLAERLIPAIPSNTFPNHVTLVTGVAPEEHGLVNNVFLDPQRGLFAKREIPDWIEVEPLWSLLARQGVVSASYHWVGSEGPWRGRGPRYWKKFSSRTSERDKVEQILAWLDLPEDAPRPRLITSWFHGADAMGHRHGPGTPAVRRHLREQDRAIAKLIEGLDERGLFESTTLIFVSDHGMVAPAMHVDLDSGLARAGIEARVLGIGGFATVVPEANEEWSPGTAERVAEVARGLGLDAMRPGRAPASAGIGHIRFGEVVVTAPIDRAIVHEDLSVKGFHGYDPSYPEMGAIFVAGGRGIPEGRSLPAFSSLSVAPTVLYLLGIDVPPWMRGEVIPISADGLDPDGG